MTVQPDKLELIVEDDELLNSFYAKWASPRGYLAVARSTPEPEVYCELNGQENGFRSKTLTYAIDGRTLRFKLASGESFLRGAGLHAMALELPRNANLAKVRRCLAAVLAVP